MAVGVSSPLPPRRMVQSRFIHKILAEHKRRGLHPKSSSYQVHTWRKEPPPRPATRPQSHLSLRGICEGFFFSYYYYNYYNFLLLLIVQKKQQKHFLMHHNNLTPDMDSASPTCRTESPFGTVCQKTPEDAASSPASSSESSAKV